MTGYWPSFFLRLCIHRLRLSPQKQQQQKNIGQNHAWSITHMFSVRVAKGGGEEGEIRGS